jgi:hypothetical protein
MKAVVTQIGQYNGAPAFEYEVREDDDTVLAFDYVIIHPHEGESWDDLAAMVEVTFLPKRLAKWVASGDEASRNARRERRTGGKRLPAGDAPLIGNAQPSGRHRVSASLSGSQAGRN